MSKDVLNSFFAAIDPFRSLWQSFGLAGLAIRKNGAWVCLGARVSLDESASSGSSRTLRGIEDFFAFEINLPIRELEGIVGKMVEELQIPPLPSQVFDDPILLSKEPLDPSFIERLNRWNKPFRHERFQSKTYHSVDRTSLRISANLDQLSDLVSADTCQRLNWLIDKETEFEGLTDLAKSFIPNWSARSREVLVAEVIAPLPFDLKSHSPERVLVHAPTQAFMGGVDLKIVFKPAGGGRRIRFPQDKTITDNIVNSREYSLEWPGPSESAKATLYYADQLVDSLECVFRGSPPVIPLQSIHRFLGKHPAVGAKRRWELIEFPKWMTSVK